MEVKTRSEPPLETRQARVGAIRRLLSKELAALMLEATKPLSSNYEIAAAVLDRLDPAREVPELIRAASLQQLTYEIGRITTRPRRRW
jgi:hypothetical protein